MGHQDLAEFVLEGDPSHKGRTPAPKESTARRVLRHWRLAIALGLFIWSLIEVYQGPLSHGLKLGSKWVITLVFFFPGLAVLVMWAKESFARVSILREPERVDQILAKHSGRLGRRTDIEQIMAICEGRSVVHLTGESGVGKTSILRVGLAETMLALKRFVPLYIDNLGGEWDESEEEALRAVIAAAAPSLQGLRGRSSAFTLLASMPRDAGVPVVIFDEFNGYITRHSARLIDKNGAWISPEELQSRSKFWRKMFDLAKDGSCRLMFVARTDESDGLNPFVGANHESRRLNKLESQLIMQIAREIDGCTASPEHGWKLLSERMVEDLSRRRGYILPIEATLVFTALKTMRILTLREYGRLGGVEGLIGRRINRDVEEAAAPGMRSDDLLRALSTMYVEEAGSNFRPVNRSEDALRKGLDEQHARVTPEALKRSLNFLAQRRIIRIGYHSDSTVWTVYHSYIARAISRLASAKQTASDRLDLAYAEYRAASGWIRWNKLLAPPALVRTLAMAAAGRLHVEGKGAFLARSSLKLTPYLLLLFLPLVLADLGVQLPGGAGMRRWLDQCGASVFRRPHSREEIAAEARRLGGRMKEVIDGRRSAQGWIMSFNETVPDMWAHGQANCALLRDAPDAAAVERIFVSLRSMFDPRWRVMTKEEEGRPARPVGWCQRWFVDPTPVQMQEMITESYPRAEILFWTASAVFGTMGGLGAEHEAEGAERTEFLRRSMESYWGIGGASDSGAWNRYIDQSTGPGDHSVYISGLALMALLDAAQSGVEMRVAGIGRDELIRRTCDWIWGARVEHDGFVGWADEKRKDIIPIDGLTFQTYSALLRAARRGCWTCPEELTDGCLAYLRRVYEGTLRTEMTSRRLQSFKNSFGHSKYIEYPLTFLTYPWLVECAATLLERTPGSTSTALELSASEQRSVYAILSSMVVDQGETHLEAMLAVDPFTYRRAEALYAFAQVRRVMDEGRGVEGVREVKTK